MIIARTNLPKNAMPRQAVSTMYPVARAALSLVLISWVMVWGLVVEHIVCHNAILENPMASDIGIFFVHMDFVKVLQSFGH